MLGGQHQEYKQMVALDRTSRGKVANFICLNLTLKNSFALKQNRSKGELYFFSKKILIVS